MIIICSNEEGEEIIINSRKISYFKTDIRFIGGEEVYLLIAILKNKTELVIGAFYIKQYEELMKIVKNLSELMTYKIKEVIDIEDIKDDKFVAAYRREDWISLF